MIAVAALTIFTYLLASIPFSLVLGFVFLKKDIREYGDGNPGTTNLYRASGNIAWFIAGLLLDGFKGLFPVGIPYWYFGWTGWEIVPVGFAAVLGHSYSIFLGFKGGKSVATSSGIWVGILVLEAVAVLATMLAYWQRFLKQDEWVVVAWWLSWLLYLLLTKSSDAPLLTLWALNGLVLLLNHRRGLSTPPILMPFRKNDE